VLAALAVRTVLFAYSWRSESADFIAWPLSILLLAGLHAARDVWLVRTTSADLRRELGDACGKLRLTCEESPPGEFRLIQSGQIYVFAVRPLHNRLQWVRLPPKPTGKAALLVLWLRKRYHSIAPRLRFVLSSSPERTHVRQDV
jgi:hypothetical protein